MSKRKKQAIQDFSSGYNCAQAVFASFAPDYGIEKEQAYKLACGVGGGFRYGEICGAASGAAMIIGLKCGNSDNKDIECRDGCYENTIAFMEKFKAKNRDVMTCKEILGVNIFTAEGQQEAMKNYNEIVSRCVNAIESAIDILEEMGY